MALQVHALPALSDNYIWVIGTADSRGVHVVDPGEAAPVENFLRDAAMTLDGILVTHHHPDHVGGVDRLLQQWPVPVHGPDSRIRQVSHPLPDNAGITIYGVPFEALAVPGHTLDHTAYVARPEGEPPLLFSGDTLFAGGCGRLFEGDPPMMMRSLERLASLPPETRVYCGHEYTLANLTFAAAADPHNTALQERRERERARMEREGITLPSTMSEELATNPFLRCHSDAIKQGLTERIGRRPDDDIETFAELRRWKDRFRA